MSDHVDENGKLVEGNVHDLALWMSDRYLLGNHSAIRAALLSNSALTLVGAVASWMDAVMTCRGPDEVHRLTDYLSRVTEMAMTP